MEHVFNHSLALETVRTKTHVEHLQNLENDQQKPLNPHPNPSPWENLLDPKLSANLTNVC